MIEILSFADDHGINPRIERMPMVKVNTTIKKARETRLIAELFSRKV